MTDVLIGACWTLICILVGGLITLVLLAVLGDRGDPGIEDEEPAPGPIEPEFWVRERERLMDEIQAAWLRENTTTEFFEADLLGREEPPAEGLTAIAPLGVVFGAKDSAVPDFETSGLRCPPATRNDTSAGRVSQARSPEANLLEQR